MTLRKYIVRRASVGTEGERVIKAHNPDQAAEAFARLYWDGVDSPDDISVNVRSPRGDATAWVVRAEQSVQFKAVRS